jgi:hypothetical protein
LSRRGVSLTAGALGVAISEAASAALPPGLVGSTAKAAVLISTGQVAGIAGSVVVLMQIGAKAMYLAKLKATLATVVVLAFVGGGIVYSGGTGQAPPKNDFEALRRENELLKVNQRALLERIETLEKQLAAAKEPVARALNASRDRLELEEARRRQLEATKTAKENELMRRLLEAEKATIPYPETANSAKKPADPNSVRVNLNTNLNKIADDPLLPESVRRAAREALRMNGGANRPADNLPKAGSPGNVLKGS